MSDYHKRHEPYMAAVRRAFDAAGFTTRDWSAEPNDPRDGGIELAPSSCGDWDAYDEVWVGWQEERGWTAVGYRNGPGGLKADFVWELDFLGGRMATIASPTVVVAGFCDAVGLPWTAAHDEYPDADFPDHEQDDDEDPAFEAALAVYAEDGVR